METIAFTFDELSIFAKETAINTYRQNEYKDLGEGEFLLNDEHVVSLIKENDKRFTSNGILIKD